MAHSPDCMVGLDPEYYGPCTCGEDARRAEARHKERADLMRAAQEALASNAFARERAEQTATPTRTPTERFELWAVTTEAGAVVQLVVRHRPPSPPDRAYWFVEAEGTTGRGDTPFMAVADWSLRSWRLRPVGAFAAAAESRGKCSLPPPGWECSRNPGHDGPCAAMPSGGFRCEAVNPEGFRCTEMRGHYGMHSTPTLSQVAVGAARPAGPPEPACDCERLVTNAADRGALCGHVRECPRWPTNFGAWWDPSRGGYVKFKQARGGEPD
jgi:hypothetical protein